MKTQIVNIRRTFLPLLLALACILPASPAVGQPVLFVGVGYEVTNAIYSTNGSDWLPAGPMPVATGWGGATCGAGMFVAISCDGDGVTAYSPDGTNWTAGTIPAENWIKVGYGNGLFFATTADNSDVALSTNGINWTVYTNALPESGYWYGLSYGNGVYVAIIAGDGQYAAWSTNGITWTGSCSGMPYSAYWQAVTYGNGMFVAVVGGTNQSAYSYDGNTWYAGSGLPSDNWASVAYGSGMFVATAYNSDGSAYSYDGMDWNASEMPFQDNWYMSAYGGGVFVTLSQRDGNAAYTSNGVDWDYSSDGLPAPEVWYGLAARDDSPVITSQPVSQEANAGTNVTFSVGTTGYALSYQWYFDGTSIAGATNASFTLFNVDGTSAGIYAVVVFAADGLAWTASDTASLIVSPPADEALFAAAANNNANAIYSMDGSNWFASPTGMPAAFSWQRVVYGANKYVAISWGSTNVAYSLDGRNWAASPGGLPTTDNWVDLAYGNGKFITVAYGSSQAAYSTDGTNWSNSTLPSTRDWNCVGYGNGIYVAIAGYSSSAVYSGDGINWTNSPSGMPYNAYWQCVAYGNGVFAALVGGTGQAAYSTNGSNWAVATGLPYNNWGSITFGNGVFIAVAYDSDQTAYSTNGINWHAATNAASALWYSSAFADFGNGIFVAPAIQSPNASYSLNGITWLSSPSGLPYYEDTWYTVGARQNPEITLQPQGQTAVVGNIVSLSTTAGGPPPLGYQWLLNGAYIAGATNSTLLLFNIDATQAGAYSVIVSNAWGSTESSNAYLTVSTPSYVVVNTNHIPNGPTSLTNFTFQGDTTYFINGPILLYGTTTIEGGTVIKYGTNNSCQLDVMGTNFICATASYRPAVFTSMDDNSAGQPISGSSGVPLNNNAGITALYFTNGAAALHNVRFSHLAVGVIIEPTGSNSLTTVDFQVVDCGQAFVTAGATCFVLNGLIYDVGNVFGANAVSGFGGQMLVAVNLTAHDCGTYAVYHSNTLYFTNCLMAAVTNLYTNAGTIYTNSTYFLTDDTGVFRIVGAGGHYLADDSPYQDAGTTNIYTNLLADLQMKTTYPPDTSFDGLITGGWFTNDYTFSPQAQRDNSGSSVDIGYHYDPIDYAVYIAISNSTATVLPGTVLAAMGPEYGIATYAQATINCLGTATIPVWIVRYNTVQEQSTTNWETPTWQGALDGFAGGGNLISPLVTFEFTEWSGLAGDSEVLCSYEPIVASFANCQFYNGSISGAAMTFQITNCLFQRVNLTMNFEGQTLSNEFCNNLFLDGEFAMLLGGGRHNPSRHSGTWIFRDNLFDQTLILTNGTTTNDIISNNAYVTTNFGTLLLDTNDVILTNRPAYEYGLLGDYYYPTNQTNLIFAGSQLASAAGLYHYTVTTNNVKDGTNQVSIGFHYVACDTNGVPLSTPADGIPDYVADANGNGIVDPGEISWTNYYSLNGLTSANGLTVFTPLQ